MAKQKNSSKKLKKIKKKQEETATDVLEESVHILKKNALRLLPVYYLGAFPFAIYLLYFINDMSLGKPLHHETVNAALLLTLLFAWKNFMQSIFCLRTMNILNFKEDEPLKFKKLLRIFIFQNIVQPLGLFVQIISAILAFPIAYTTAFFNSFAVLTSVNNDELQSSFKNALKLSFIKQKQNHCILFILFFFYLMVMLNIGISILILPRILKTFFGIENIFTISNDIFLIIKTIFNTTYWSIVLVCAWLFVDPIVKAAYTVRTFYGESASRGYDILAKLSRLLNKPAGLCLPFVIALFLFVPLKGKGSEKNKKESKAMTAKLEKAIDDTLKEREYKWRLPPPEKEDIEKKRQSNFIAEVLKSLVEKIKDIAEWIADVMNRFLPENKNSAQSSSGFFGAIANNLLIILLLLCLLIGAGICFTVLLYMRRRRLIKNKIALQEKPALPPDLNDEALTADELEENAWLKLADELANEGKLRLALRAVFFAALSLLANKKLLTIAKFKTNREYLTELKRRSHSNKLLIELFNGNLVIFEKIWYGDYDVSSEIFDEMKRNYETMARKSIP